MVKKSAKMPQSKDFLSLHPDIERVEAFIVDVNGILRGKWIPRKSAEKLFSSGLRLPTSLYAVDIWGEDTLGAGLVTETGDGDGLCKPVAESMKLVPWHSKPVAQIMLGMETAEGTPFFGDPRNVLQNILLRFAKLGLTPVAATELEFYLFDTKTDENGAPLPPRSQRTGKKREKAQLYCLKEIGEFEPLLAEIAESCKTQDIPADTTISEGGPGQFEINLNHVENALLAADHAVMMKRAIKGVARKHGLEASFMAKPFTEDAGNGFHVHLSILDKNGKNIFKSKKPGGSAKMMHAIGGLCETMKDGMAVFAPNANSYRRFVKGSHAPTKIAWGYDNRFTAIRIPDTTSDAARFEHRVSSADANPYLVLSVILGGILYGLENQIAPPKATEGNAYNSKAEKLPNEWEKALKIFGKSAFIEDMFGTDYHKLYMACKKQEKEKLESRISNIEYDAYLRTV